MKIKFLLLSFFLFHLVHSQTTGSLTGRIFDIQSQLPLEGATLLLEGTSLGTVTDSDGYFKLENIPSQSYNITASYLGYESQTQFNIIVKSIGNIPLLFELSEVLDTIDWVCRKTAVLEQPRPYGNRYEDRAAVAARLDIDAVIASANKPPKIRWRQS